MSTPTDATVQAMYDRWYDSAIQENDRLLLTERIRAALTDEVINEISKVAFRTATKTRLSRTQDLAWRKAWREGIITAITGE